MRRHLYLSTGAAWRRATLLAGMLLVSSFAFADDFPGNAKWLEPERSTLMRQSDRLPFFPHRANTTGNTVLRGDDFDDAQVCGACHTQIYAQWRSSVMSHAWDDPIYRALLKFTSEARPGLENFCTGCHTPIGLTTGQISPALTRGSVEVIKRTHPLPGVDCESCHNVSARTGLDNGSYVLSPKAHGKPTKFGPRKDAVSPYHDTVYSELHTRSDFCAMCHNVTHPFTSVALERTYDEWLESPYSINSENCQSCHMPGFAGKAAIMGPDRADVASHTFAGANATLLENFGHQDNAERARSLLARAATLEFLQLPDSLTPGKLTSVAVKVTNRGAGHKLPSGFPEGREIWIDFTVTDATGRQIYRLGAVKGGATEAGTRSFKVHLGDKDGREVDLEVWKVARILSDSRILPKGYDIQEFWFIIPEEAVGPISVRAELNYWPFSQKLVDFLLGEGVMMVEISQMAAIARSIPLSTGGSVARAGGPVPMARRPSAAWP